ncbi:uncharacterized protein LOC119721694 [Patiria miniata]|uniref:MYND-type domain-containing protein n=1 Tax=Patiria miniata TaxID=46514 RepID=A0A913Z7F4_PATMI|nr:uncharacterized protein LOC119721694 [Patiria miniata]
MHTMTLFVLPDKNMDVRKGHCWRCEKPLPKHPTKCRGCPQAEYCSSGCQGKDQVRHGSVECKLFGPKPCSHCGKSGLTKECASCNHAWYCDARCQHTHWATHKEECKNITRNVKGTAPLVGQYHTEKGGQIFRTEEPPAYIGNTIANNFLRLEENEWSELADVGQEELARDYHVLSAGCGDLRNTVLTIASLPARYRGRLDVTLDDFDPFVMARNVLSLFMMARYATRDGIASSMATIWYSMHISGSEYELIRAALQELVEMSVDDLRNQTQGLVSIGEADVGYLREVWKGWLALKCQRSAGDSINLKRQRKEIFDGDTDFKNGFQKYLNRIPGTDAKYMEEWFQHGLFLPKDVDQSCLAFDNPTLTARPSVGEASNETQQRLGVTTPKEYSFVYSTRTDQTPYLVWDCLRVDELQSKRGSSVMVKYHAYVTHLLQKTIKFISQHRLVVRVFLANCLDFPNHHLTLGMPNYDRIFTSNLADYLGHCRLLKTFKPMLNSANKHSTIVTQTLNWMVCFMPEANVSEASFHDVASLSLMCQMDTGFSYMLSMDVGNQFEYYNNTHWFLAFLRTEIMAGGVGIPVMDHVPKLSEVMQYEGLRMRDFRKERNRLVPFQYRVNARRITMLRGHERNVEWCLNDPNTKESQ